MAKRVREELVCDVCQKADNVTRYTVNFPEGLKILDRCPKHSNKVLALRDEPGAWRGKGRTTKIVTVTAEEIRRARNV